MNEHMRKCADLGDSLVKALKGASDEQKDAMPGVASILRLHFSQSLIVLQNKRKVPSALDEDEGPKKRKRNAKPKDPNAPRRPASAYILFQNEVRKELKERYPTLNNSELLVKISEMWKQMSDEEKAVSNLLSVAYLRDLTRYLQFYHKAVESAKERYSQDKKAYDNRSPEEVAAANAAVAEAAAVCPSLVHQLVLIIPGQEK